MPVKPKSYVQLLAASHPDAHGRQQHDREYRVRRLTDPLQVATERLRSSGRWKRARKWKLTIAPLCETCIAHGVTTVAVDVDHVVPLVEMLAAGRREESFQLTNLASICRACHNVKTSMERADRDARATTSTAKTSSEVDAERGRRRGLIATHRAFDEDTSPATADELRRGGKVDSGALQPVQRRVGNVPILAGNAPFSSSPPSPANPASTRLPGRSEGDFGHARREP